MGHFFGSTQRGPSRQNGPLAKIGQKWAELQSFRKEKVKLDLRIQPSLKKKRAQVIGKSR